ncbi:actin cytoskeleton-regulatory complex pan-like protein [Parasponia andersonii]|uniref:Actin cytoskeleton-regulatory complex pan-like protein n=1 Tax=Parasponia andersonii TaxID=3476 RepID=A0A2P5B542_PARAD|nr:actin cytoskeleton-regulatory complex pan-like protein [Parasponia andersonii]
MSYSGWPCSRAPSHRRNYANSRRRITRPAPSTPLLRWDSSAAVCGGSSPATEASGAVRLSARKIAAGLWQHRFKEISFGGGAADPLFRGSTRDHFGPQLESSLPYPNCVGKTTTKGGDRGCSKASDDVYYIFSHQKLLTRKQSTRPSIISTLQAELAQSRSRVRELEAKKLSLRKRVKHLLNKLQEERMIPWQRIEQRRNCAAIEDLTGEIVKERKSRRKMEILNTKLVDHLADVKFCAEQLIRDYEEEKKKRERVEEVCEKLAQRIGEDKAEVERLKMEYVKVREELEEERKMLQFAEVWREERVQMKLVDAKLALEDKYSKMNTLVTELEAFLRSASGSLNGRELRKAETILKEAVKSLNSRDIMEEFSYVPTQSNDIFSIMKELRECEGSEREIGPCNSPSRGSHDSIMASDEINGLEKHLVLMYSNYLSDYNSVLDEDAAACDAASHAEDQSSCPSPGRSNSSLTRVNHCNNNVLCNRPDCDEEAGQLCSPSAETSQVSVPTKKTKQNSSSHPRIRGSDDCDRIYKIVSSQGHKRLPNGIISNFETSSLVRHFSEHKLGRRAQWISASFANPHITRGMKGCIEWPRAIQKNVSKAKLSEATIQSQKAQLRHILKPKT